MELAYIGQRAAAKARRIEVNDDGNEEDEEYGDNEEDLQDQQELMTCTCQTFFDLNNSYINYAFVE